MDIEEALRAVALPDAPVGTDGALNATLRRGRRHHRRRRAIAALSVVAVAAIVGATVLGLDDDNGDQHVAAGPTTLPRSAPEPGEPATWTVETSSAPSAAGETFIALVSRLDCNSGKTGAVLRPGIAFTTDQVVVTFTVGPRVPGDAACQGNDQVPTEVALGEPLGDRALVDGSCLPGTDAATTSFCSSDHGVRWRGGSPPPDGARQPISGSMQSVGGPQGAELDPTPGTVSAVDAEGRIVQSVQTDAQGHFELDVPAWSYRIEGRSAGFGEGESGACSSTSAVTVTEAGIDGIAVLCQRK